MCQYKLLADHVTSDGLLLEAGTDVGDDTPYPWKNVDGSDLRPSTQMLGLDDAGKAAVVEVWEGLYGHPPPWEAPSVDMTARKAAYDAQLAADKAAAPVSEQQALEKKIAQLREEGLPPPPSPPVVLSASRTRGGVDNPAPPVPQQAPVTQA